MTRFRRIVETAGQGFWKQGITHPQVAGAGLCGAGVKSRFDENSFTPTRLLRICEMLILDPST